MFYFPLDKDAYFCFYLHVIKSISKMFSLFSLDFFFQKDGTIKLIIDFFYDNLATNNKKLLTSPKAF